jgi:hypothetical protein
VELKWLVVVMDVAFSPILAAAVKWPVVASQLVALISHAVAASHRVA